MKKHAKILTAMLLGWVSYTSALYAALDYSGQDVSREWWSSWSGDFKDANFTDATVIYTTFAGTIDLSGNIGKISGDIFKNRDADKLTDNLWLEVILHAQTVKVRLLVRPSL